MNPAPENQDPREEFSLYVLSSGTRSAKVSLSTSKQGLAKRQRWQGAVQEAANRGLIIAMQAKHSGEGALGLFSPPTLPRSHVERVCGVVTPQRR